MYRVGIEDLVRLKAEVESFFMQDNRINALAEFLKVVPEALRLRGNQLKDEFSVIDHGERISASLKSTDGRMLSLRFDFDPKVFNIVAAFCNCRRAEKGSVCEHICGFASHLAGEGLMEGKGKRSLAFLDKHFNAPAFQNAQFQLSVELVEMSFGLEPNIMFHKYIKEGTFGVGRKFTANDSYKFIRGNPDDQSLLDYVRSFRQIFFYSNYENAQRYAWGFWISLLGHPRIRFEERPIEVENGPISVDLEPAGKRYRLVVSHGQPRPAGIKYYEVNGGLLGLSREGSRLLVCQVDKFRADILMEVQQYQPTLSRAELLTNLPRLEKLQSLFNIQLPRELDGIIQKKPPELMLLLELDVRQGLTLSPRAGYEGSEGRVVPGSAGQYLATNGDVVIERDREEEKELLHEFLNLYPYEETPDRNGDIHIADLERALSLIEWLRQHSRWELEWVCGEPKIHRFQQFRGLRAQVDSGAWLKLHLLADDKTYSIESFPEDDEYLASTRYVAVGENEWIEIDRQLRQQINQIKMAVVREEKAMRLKNAALALLAEMEEVQWEGDPDWIARIEEWQGKGGNAMLPQKSLNATLRNYQLEGYRWLRRMSALGLGACLADDMGLGKTVQALAILLDRLDQGPVLVISPASVCFNWKEEAQRFAPLLKTQLYAEGRRSKNISRLKSGDVLIASYALVLRDIQKLKEVQWGTLVLDEAQFIKNAFSQTAMAVGKLQRDWTLVLTGTPLENHLGELWSIFRMLNPELLGGWEHFHKHYMIPIERDRDPQRMENLRRLLRPFILRRTKQKVLDDLPERSDILLKVTLGDAQRAKYEAERKRILKQLDKSSDSIRFRLLAAITRLRQLACHPALCEERYKGESAKLSIFSELVEELVSESHHVLVFSQFTSFLGLIALELNRIRIPHVMMTGETPVKHRQGIINRFQEGEVPVFLVSLRAGGTGLNLTYANYVVHMDPWWNPSVEEQATDRAHRIGQTQAVTVYRLVAGDTIEEAILDIHDRKKDLVQSLLEGKDSAGKLSIEDMVGLVRGGK